MSVILFYLGRVDQASRLAPGRHDPRMTWNYIIPCAILVLNLCEKATHGARQLPPSGAGGRGEGGRVTAMLQIGGSREAHHLR